MRMLTLIALYWTKEVHAIRMNEIKFFKDEAKHRLCKTMDVKIILLFLHVS
jgi:hypothetical protein